jgi:predicted Kef-type K+ transport protein
MMDVNIASYPYRVVFGVFFLLNLVLWAEGSSAAIPFSTLIALLALWFGISVPLTFVGAYFGYKRRVSINASGDSLYKFMIMILA